MISKKKILIIVISIACIFSAMKIFKIVSENNAIRFADNFTRELSNKYGLDSPEFTVVADEIEQYLWVKVNFFDERFESLSNEDKYNFLKDYEKAPFHDKIIYSLHVEIPLKNTGKTNSYSIDFDEKNILLLNNVEIYEHLTEEEKEYREDIAKKPPQLKMREKDLEHTRYGKADRIEKSLDFDKKVPRACHKTYYWDDEDFQVTVWYTYNVDGTVNGNRECPKNNGYVWSIRYKEGRTYKTKDLSGSTFSLN